MQNSTTWFIFTGNCLHLKPNLWMPEVTVQAQYLHLPKGNELKIQNLLLHISAHIFMSICCSLLSLMTWQLCRQHQSCDLIGQGTLPYFYLKFNLKPSAQKSASVGRNDTKNWIQTREDLACLDTSSWGVSFSLPVGKLWCFNGFSSLKSKMQLELHWHLTVPVPNSFVLGILENVFDSLSKMVREMWNRGRLKCCGITTYLTVLAFLPNGIDNT